MAANKVQFSGNKVQFKDNKVLFAADADPCCCAAPETCLCDACGTDTPRWLKVTLAGTTLLSGEDGRGYTFTQSGTVAGTYCIPFTDGPGAPCGWRGWFRPGGYTATVTTSVIYCDLADPVDDGVTFTFGIYIEVLYQVEGGVPGWRTTVAIDLGPNYIDPHVIFTGFTAAACADSGTAANDQAASASHDNGRYIQQDNWGFGGTALVEPGACAPADCNATEPACSECHGTTPDAYTLTLAFQAPFDIPGWRPGPQCYNYSASKWVSIDTSDLEGTFTLTRGAGTSCTWTGTIPAFAFEYYDDDGSGCGSGTHHTVMQGCAITLTKIACGYTLEIVSDDGLFHILPGGSSFPPGFETTNLYGACGDFRYLWNVGDCNFLQGIGTRC